MRVHELAVRRRRVDACDREIVANGVASDAVSLALDHEWDGLSIVIVLGSCDAACSFAWDGSPVKVPSALLAEPGWLPVSVVGYGQDGEVRLTTERADRLLKVVPSGCVEGGEPIPDEPGLLGQILGARDEALEAAQEAREAADAAQRASRGTQISITEGRPAIGGIEGDSAVDCLTGKLWEFVDDGSATG